MIIEDQLPAQRILKGYIDKVNNLELVGTYLNPIKALNELDSKEIDILFLDIHLPKISGINLLKSLNKAPNIVITTAFSEYALQGFDLDVIDYLLKPYSFDRFLKSISKIKRVVKEEQPILYQQDIFVKTKGVIQKIKIKDILFIESKGDFVLLSTQVERHIVSSSLQKINNKLGSNFIRCHKSYVIKLSAIDKIVGNTIKIGMFSIPIGRTFRDKLIKQLKLI